MEIFHRIPLAVPDLRGNEEQYLRECVTTNWVSSAGPFISEFEKRIAAIAGTRHGIAVVNGTCALELALRTGARPDGERRKVIVPDWTFAGTVNAVYHAGFTPHFLDVCSESWTLDPHQLAEVLQREAAQIAAIVPVHALGHPADMTAITETAAVYGIPVIEDSAAGLGATCRGRPAGTFGLASMVSFNGNKTLTAGGGGMIVTNDDDLAGRIRFLMAQARPGQAYRHEQIGFNYRMTNVNAAVGLAQAERFEELLAAKRRIAAGYAEVAAQHPKLQAQPNCDWAESSDWMSCVLCESPAEAMRLERHLNAANIDARIFWESLSGQPAYAGFPRESVSQSMALSGRVVALPCSSSLTKAEFSRVAESVAAWR
jgi:perosamine synthetase